MRGRQRRADRSQLPHVGSRSLVRSAVDFLSPRSGGTDGVEVVAKVQKDNLEKVLRGNGEFGVLSGPFFVKGDAPRVQGCPTPSRILTSRRLMRKGKVVALSILGVVFRGMGLGLRRKECDFESVVGQVYSEEESKILFGDRREATNLLHCSGAMLRCRHYWQSGFAQSKHSFRAGKTRSAIIWSAVPPLHRRPQHHSWVFAYPARGTTQTSTFAGPWCGRNQENPQRKVKRLRNLGRVWSKETPRHQ